MIELRNLSKSYRTPKGRHHVFRDLNLVIPSGKSVGLIGRNGAGKSTLLRIMGGIDRPDSGRVITDKSISWPVGLSGGFQGSMTGRENVKFVCRIYSRKDDMASKLRFIEDFAEIGKYFDMPVKSYSSGMRSRLAFGLSMAFDFDYYLIDEVTAVGDAAFKAKSAALMAQKREQKNFIMVSHSLGALKQFCDVAVLLDRQDAHYFENIDEAIETYLSHEVDKKPA